METYLERLEERFKRILSIRSTRNKSDINSAWKTVVQSHANRNYHNLWLAFHDLFINCDGVPILVSDETAMAIFFRHIRYHPKQSSMCFGIEPSIEYMSFILSDMFGWQRAKINHIIKLMRSGQTLAPPSADAKFDHEDFLIRDMKIARLAKPYSNFINDRNNLISELVPHYKLNDIFVMEFKVFRALQKRPNLFLTTLCKNCFTNAAQENIDKRVMWLSNECKVVKDKLDKKELIP